MKFFKYCYMIHFVKLGIQGQRVHAYTPMKYLKRYFKCWVVTITFRFFLSKIFFLRVRDQFSQPFLDQIKKSCVQLNRPPNQIYEPICGRGVGIAANHFPVIYLGRPPSQFRNLFINYYNFSIYFFNGFMISPPK